jgi:hypothetical protein
MILIGNTQARQVVWIWLPVGDDVQVSVTGMDVYDSAEDNGFIPYYYEKIARIFTPVYFGEPRWVEPK